VVNDKSPESSQLNVEAILSQMLDEGVLQASLEDADEGLRFLLRAQSKG